MTAIAPAEPWALAARTDAAQSLLALDDAGLVREFLASGGDEPFELLVARHKDRVYRLAVSVLGPGHEVEAEDVVQEVFLLTYSKLSTFRSGARFSTWLYRVARNRAIDRLRREGRRRAEVGEEFLSELSDSGTDADPGAVAVARQERSRLRRAVADLPEPQQTVVRLFYWLACPVDEIAELLEIAPGTVKSHLYRARQRIARQLQVEAPSD